MYLHGGGKISVLCIYFKLFQTINGIANLIPTIPGDPCTKYNEQNQWLEKYRNMVFFLNNVILIDAHGLITESHNYERELILEKKSDYGWLNKKRHLFYKRLFALYLFQCICIVDNQQKPDSCLISMIKFC